MTGQDSDAERARDSDADESGDDRTGPVRRNGRREVVVPERLYKTVTVFSTLIAMAGVVGGFVALDYATDRASATLPEVNVPLALFGLACIVAGGLVYAYGTRFRAAGMETDNNDEDDASDNG